MWVNEQNPLNFSCFSIESEKDIFHRNFVPFSLVKWVKYHGSWPRLVGTDTITTSLTLTHPFTHLSSCNMCCIWESLPKIFSREARKRISLAFPTGTRDNKPLMIYSALLHSCAWCNDKGYCCLPLQHYVISNFQGAKPWR